MSTHRYIALALACCAGIAQASPPSSTTTGDSWQPAVKQFTDNPWQPAHDSSDIDVLAPRGGGLSDLDKDPAFRHSTNTLGLALYYLDDLNSQEGWGLRVVAAPGGGWFALAKHGHGNGTWDAAVIQFRDDGFPEAFYMVPTPMFRMDDATLDPVTGKFYFVGGAKQPGRPDSDFAVTCVDLGVGASGGTCAGFGNAGSGTRFIGFDRGGSNDDVARRVLVRPNLGVLVSGWAKDGADRYVFSATALYRANGALVPRFGDNGRFSTDLGSSLANLDVNVFDMALSNAADAEATLYIAGNYSRDVARADYDGVVIALNAWTGTLDSAFNGSGFRPVLLDLGTSANRSDAISAITVLANGKLAVAGWSVDAHLNHRLMLGRLTAQGQWDNRFCGNPGPCAPMPGHASGTPTQIRPTAIAERPDSRDLVIASEWIPGGADPGDARTHQLVQQWPARIGGAQPRAAEATLIVAAHGQESRNSTGGMVVTDDVVMLAGTRLFFAPDNDYDVTVLRMLANDTLHADTFGGAHSD